MLRRAIGIVCSLALVVVQVPSGFAENAAPAQPQAAPAQPRAAQAQLRVAAKPPHETVSPVIVEAFAAFPQGGDQLSKRIADIIAKEPKLAAGLVRYVQTAPGLNKEQKLAAERGLAAALNRLGIKAADLGPMVVKAPPAAVAPAFDPLPLLVGAAVIGGIVGCVVEWCRDGDDPVSP